MSFCLPCCYWLSIYLSICMFHPWHCLPSIFTLWNGLVTRLQQSIYSAPFALRPNSESPTRISLHLPARFGNAGQHSEPKNRQHVCGFHQVVFEASLMQLRVVQTVDYLTERKAHPLLNVLREKELWVSRQSFSKNIVPSKKKSK